MPVGTLEFCEAKCASWIDEYGTSQVCAASYQGVLLPSLTGFQLVRFCVNPRVQYLARTHDDDISALLAGFDEAVDEALWRPR